MKQLKISSPKGKAIISTFFVVSFLCIPKVGFLPMGAEDFDIRNNLLFPLCHANIWHLLCNLWCLMLARVPYYIYSSIAISFLCSLIPEPWACDPIMGMSGILFAMCGAKYGKAMKMRLLVKNMWVFILVSAFLPNVAWAYHLYCLVMGYLWGWAKETYRLYKKCAH